MPRTGRDGTTSKSAATGGRRASLLRPFLPSDDEAVFNRRATHATNGSSGTVNEPASPDPAPPFPSKTQATVQTSASIAAQPGLRTMSAVMSSQCPNDVSFEFPTVGKRLWTSQRLLIASAPYFATLLSSDFLEGNFLEASTSAQGTPGPSDMHDSHDLNDSDDETDEHFYGSGTPAEAAPSPNAAVSYKQIVVRGTAYTTYFAALLYFATGHISFAPLRSSFSGAGEPGSSDKDGTRLAALSKILEEAPDVPVPASPKPIYRLAHMIDCAELQQRALDSFWKQLGVTNVLAELFSDVANAHPAIRDAALDYASKHWGKISRTEQWEELKRSAADGALPAAAAHTAMLLAERTPAKPARDLGFAAVP
ncbi:hypothetical protein BMF94_5515 [Rhodotorula taiwanensis]|uniref:BTB domain-containing protein n=1 Tax=Rhodotorula taiwanensis TaxID=741276 RepID=A0A2S5B341_9BASI|nr:hypothetical protein BMF94_5515 [Rhodotorula taiwanensis]